MRAVPVGLETGARYAEMMPRYLGPVILRAFADDDVTEIYVNPQDGLVRFDTRSRGRVASGVDSRLLVFCPFLHPGPEEDRHGFGDPSLPLHPIPPTPRRDSTPA